MNKIDIYLTNGDDHVAAKGSIAALTGPARRREQNLSLQESFVDNKIQPKNLLRFSLDLFKPYIRVNFGEKKKLLGKYFQANLVKEVQSWIWEKSLTSSHMIFLGLPQSSENTKKCFQHFLDQKGFLHNDFCFDLWPLHLPPKP